MLDVPLIIGDLLRIFMEKTTLLYTEYLQAHGVLALSVNCPNCDKECRYRKEKHLFVCGQWKKIAKTKRRKQCNYSVSLFKGTFLGKVLCRRGR